MGWLHEKRYQRKLQTRIMFGELTVGEAHALLIEHPSYVHVFGPVSQIWARRDQQAARDHDTAQWGP